MKDLKIIGIVLGILILGAVFFFKSKSSTDQGKQETSVKAIVSGTVGLNGKVEAGTTIAIGEQEEGQTDFTVIVSGIEAKDGATWKWSDAKEGSNYNLQAYLQKEGKNVASSEVLLVTAPANNEELHLSVQSSSPSKETVTIAGSLDLNGYIPSQSEVVVEERSGDDSKEKVIASGIKPVDGASWKWTSAQQGKTYKIQAYLKSGGKIIGRSREITVTAPAKGEVLRINSQEKPAPEKSGISGTINLNGSVPDHAKLVVFQRKTGEGQFAIAVNEINPTDGASWDWQEAEKGVTYDIQAVLKIKEDGGSEKDVAHSNYLKAAAPAKDEVLTINTNVSIPQPPSPEVRCQSKSGGNQWNILVVFNSVNDANQYWVEVGTEPGRNDVYDEKMNRSDSPQIATTVNNNTFYYARYAYAYCQPCAERNFSSFSGTTTFSCPPQPATPTPTPKYTGYVCDLAVGCQLTTDPDAPYQPNNEGLRLCQLACKPTPTLTPSPTPTPTPVCEESLQGDACTKAGGTIRCLNGPCFCVCPE